MNIIVYTHGIGVGGMEVFFSGFIHFVIKKGHKVYFVSQVGEKNIFNELLKDLNGQFVWVDFKRINIAEKTERQCDLIREGFLKKLNIRDYENTAAIAGYYSDMVFLTSMFSSINQVRMLLIWPHPLNWPNALFSNPKTYNTEKKINSPQYKYQKALVKEIDDAGGNYYTSYAIFDFTNWYYDADMKPRDIEGLPIQVDNGKSFTYCYDSSSKVLRILWVGRFDYFKNDAIVYTLQTLDELSEKYNDIHFVFNIVGRGTVQFEQDIKKRATSEKVEVNFMGAVSPTKLNDVFSQNDIGIAMGVTVKQMGYSGLPSILIDSLTSDYNSDKICNWVFDIDTGDDGDGYYYYLANSPLEKRERLGDLLESVIMNPECLNEYSKKSQVFVNAHYSYEKQNTIILERAIESKYKGSKIPIYHYPFSKRVEIKLRKAIIKLKNIVTKC